MKKWINEAYVKKIIAMVESGETYVLLNTNKLNNFLVFDPNFSVIYNPEYTGDYNDLESYKEGDKIRFELVAFRIIKKTEENKTRIEYEEDYGYQRIKEIVGKVVDIDPYNVILKVGTLYIKAIDRMEKRPKIGDYVYCELGNTQIKNIEKIEDEK